MKTGDVKTLTLKSGIVCRARITGDPIGPGCSVEPVGELAFMTPGFPGPYFPVEVVDTYLQGATYIVDSRDLR